MVWSLVSQIFLLIFVFIYFHQLNDGLDEHNESTFWELKLQFQYNSPDKIILFSLYNLKNYRKKSKLVDSYTISQQAQSTTIMA